MSLKQTSNKPFRLIVLTCAGLFCLTAYGPQYVNHLSDVSVSVPQNHSKTSPAHPTNDQFKVHTASREQSTQKELEQNLTNNYNQKRVFKATTPGSLIEKTFVEKPSTVAGGGMVVELNGAFRSHMSLAALNGIARHTTCNHVGSDHSNDNNSANGNSGIKSHEDHTHHQENT